MHLALHSSKRTQEVSGDTKVQSETRSVEQAGTLTLLPESPIHQRCDALPWKSNLFMSTQALLATPKRCWAQYPRPLQRAQHLSSWWTPGKISATPLGQTSRSSFYRASQVSTSSACQFSQSADSTHDPNCTGRSEVMVRVSTSREEKRSRRPELLCNNAIPSASERSETTTIPLCEASTD